MTIRIRAAQLSQYIVAYPGDCIYPTYIGKRHTSVLRFHGIQGAVTTRPGELGVYIGGIE